MELVPEMEEREAAQQAGIAWTLWPTLHHSDRALAVAHYRVRREMDMHIRDASAREQRRRQAKEKPRRKKR